MWSYLINSYLMSFYSAFPPFSVVVYAHQPVFSFVHLWSDRPKQTGWNGLSATNSWKWKMTTFWTLTLIIIIIILKNQLQLLYGFWSKSMLICGYHCLTITLFLSLSLSYCRLFVLKPWLISISIFMGLKNLCVDRKNKSGYTSKPFSKGESQDRQKLLN